MADIQAPYLGKTGKVKLDAGVFGEPFNGSLVHEVVRAERNALRSGNASTKTRGQIAMTGAKAWRQKGTGRARGGALSSPTRFGGGVAFGPKPRRYTVKVNRKARRKALRSAWTESDSVALLDATAFFHPRVLPMLSPRRFGFGRTLAVRTAATLTSKISSIAWAI